jgi:hypothetical protein
MIVGIATGSLENNFRGYPFGVGSCGGCHNVYSRLFRRPAGRQFASLRTRQSRKFIRSYRDGAARITCAWIIYEAVNRIVTGNTISESRFGAMPSCFCLSLSIFQDRALL